jgi:RimJ/RimL family protein N-acetyltransferase
MTQRFNPLTWLRRHRRRLRPARPRLVLARIGGTDGMAPGTAAHDEPGGPASGDLVRAGRLVRLRRHVPANRAAFQRWYADEEIAHLLRHDLRPLTEIQSRGYFDTIILPLSAMGTCWAIHEAATDRLIGSTALTDVTGQERRSALFRIVIGEKDAWGHGYGTEATRLVVEEAFERLGLAEVRLEVFRHNTRAIAAYRRVGFRITGEHVEYVGRNRDRLDVIEMALDREEGAAAVAPARTPNP